MNILFLIILMLIITGVVFYFLVKRNNQNRKENLNIIKDDNKVNFYLSDDLFFTLNISEHTKLTHVLIKTIRDEIFCLEKTVRKISLINLGDKVLEKRLNKMLVKAQKIN